MEKRIYYLSAAACMIASVFSLGFHHPDEHFQILEFAGARLGLSDPHSMPWEYAAEMRSAFQPFIVFFLYRFQSIFGVPDPFTIAFILRLFSAALSLVCIYAFTKTFSPEVNDPGLRRWFVVLSFLLWFIVYHNVRFSSENWSGKFFILGLVLIYRDFKTRRWITTLAAGIALGLSFVMRYQSLFLISGLVAWLIFMRKEKYGSLALLCSGIGLACMAGLAVDRWYYGHWTITAWNYIDQNILQDKAVQFGKAAWWFYFSEGFTQLLPPFSILFILSMLMFLLFKRGHVLTWITIPFLLVHFLISHKEIRFLFPIETFLPFFLISSIDIIAQRNTARLSGSVSLNRAAIVLFLVYNAIPLLYICCTPARLEVITMRDIYHYTRNDPGATLYFKGSDPYGDPLRMNFYSAQKIKLQKINGLDEIAANGSRFLVLGINDTIPGKLKDDLKLEMISSNFPGWLSMFNYHDWMKHQAFGSLYSIKNK
jgi:phosphatidylinositol glycan class B